MDEALRMLEGLGLVVVSSAVITPCLAYGVIKASEYVANSIEAYFSALIGAAAETVSNNGNVDPERLSGKIYLLEELSSSFADHYSAYIALGKKDYTSWVAKRLQ